MSTPVAVHGALWHRLPVKTSGQGPKVLGPEGCRALGIVTGRAPVGVGPLLVADVLGTGVDVVATRSMPVREGGIRH